MCEFWGHGRAVAVGDVGEVGDDEVKGAVELGEEVTLKEFHGALGGAVGEVFLSESEGFGGDVGEDGFATKGEGAGKAEAEDATTGAHVEESTGLIECFRK